MDLTYKQEVGVGAIVLVTVGLFLAAMFYFTGRSLRTGGITVDVMFESVAGAAMDLFGAKFVDYNPGSREEMLARGRTIAGSNQPDITDVAQGVANRANELMENAANIVSDRLGEDIHNTLVVTQRAMNTLANAPEGPFVKQTTRTL